MNELWSYHDNLIKNTQTERFRYLYDEIDWSVRMMGIKRPSGTGKTTMMGVFSITIHNAKNTIFVLII